MNIKITGSGSYIPSIKVTNSDFSEHVFLNEDGSAFNYPNDVIAQKFVEITGIVERRYAQDNQTTSQIATIAAQKAIEDANLDPETLDYIIFAHNFGDVKKGAIQGDMLPSLASKVKYNLRIKNPKCVAYDMLFGCPGWVESVIQAQAFIKAGMAKKCLVIGAETLSRVVDPHDRDSMIYSDGAGATIIEATNTEGGILSHASASYTYDEANFLFFGKSYNLDHNPDVRYIKMLGRKIYEFALSNVPKAMKECLEAANIDLSQVKKILIHQANEKMDEAIVNRFYKLYKTATPEGIMPMSIHKLGNSSVATVPTLYDLLMKGEIEDQSLNKGDIILFASVGAGMNINAIAYQM
ncbi:MULTISPECIES: 3-oxoacyl-ACP synthase III family protein [unclassified Flavobacterium]|uniref:3-oxoacyl-ACP synthase III family protein n=1 Tax=unclassified Flavobacterium TaxID=196869 RepID=UPI00129239FA|nr:MULTISPECIES: ketoacyl-ACP synthase III [unclassified Flavobacterium]MQP52170.1 ketoacyl-ACP synthase III [Flavobacterium sp. LMO9]MQP62040.1 ketoacyl-ACP synthase III [Flavobacterium sp. LMO6]